MPTCEVPYLACRSESNETSQCDEVRPVCGQCAVKNRPCTESPPKGITWVKTGQLSIQSPTSAGDGTVTKSARAKSRSPSEDGYRSSVSPGRRSKSKSPDATTHTFRVNPIQVVEYHGPDTHSEDGIPRSPTSTVTDRLRIGFMAAYIDGPPGFQLSGYNYNLHDLPKYLGSSPCLDYATHCLVKTHSVRTRGQLTRHNLGGTYLGAIRSLQAALNDPVEARRGTTLCAIALLNYAEILGDPSWFYTYLQHSGGLASLIKYLGPSRGYDDLGKIIVKTTANIMVCCKADRGNSNVSLTKFQVVDSVVKNEHCILSDPQWFWVLQETGVEPSLHRVLTQSLRHFTHIASLLKEIRSLCATPGSAIEAENLLYKAINLRKGILRTKAEVDLTLCPDKLDKSPITEIPCEPGSAPFDSFHWYPDILTARTGNMCWSMVIQINGIIARMHCYLAEAGAEVRPELSAASLRLESNAAAMMILKSVDYAVSMAPVGSAYMRFPLHLAWGSVSPLWKGWALEKAHAVMGGVVAKYHKPVVMDYTFEWLCGWHGSMGEVIARLSADGHKKEPSDTKLTDEVED